MQAVYISSNQFKVSTDRTSEFLAGRRVCANCGGVYKYSTIQSSPEAETDVVRVKEENVSATDIIGLNTHYITRQLSNG